MQNERDATAPSSAVRPAEPAAAEGRPSLWSAVAEFRRRHAGRSRRQQVYALLFPGAGGGRLHLATEMFLIFWIIASVISIVCESVASLEAAWGPVFRVIDAISFVVFGIEYLLRLYASPESDPGRPAWRMRWRFARSWQGLLDLAAILPFLVGLLFGNAIDLRFLRIVRLLRLLKLTRYSSANDTMFAVLTKEAPVLLTSSLVMVLLVFIMAAFGYLLEREAQPDKFDNIPQAMYWAVVTLASVGYGDLAPVTPAGRFATVVLALVGIGIFAIPAAVLASGFTEQLRLNREKLKQDLIAAVGEAELSPALRTELRGQWRAAHLAEAEIRLMFEQIELARRDRGAAGESGWPSGQPASPAWVIADYRATVARLQALAAEADAADIARRLARPGAATGLEQAIWQLLAGASTPETTGRQPDPPDGPGAG